MKNLLFYAFLFSFSISFSNSLESSNDEEKFNVTDMIMHHIKDSHEFHILDWKGEGVSIPLPIILWTDNGLVSFLSSEFHHDDEANEVVVKNGQSFVKYHEEIYYASLEPNKSGQYISINKDLYPTNSKPLDFSITKLVFSMFLSIVLLLLIFGVSARNYNKSDKGIPKGIAKFTEPLIVYIRDEVAIPNIGEKHHQKYMPYLLTLFFFIWINNVIGLIPPICTSNKSLNSSINIFSRSTCEVGIICPSIKIGSSYICQRFNSAPDTFGMNNPV